MKTSVFLALVLLVLAGAPAETATSGASLQSTLQSDLNSYLASRGKAEHISAVSLSINLPGASSNINVTAGTTQYGGGQPVTPNNLYQIGSNTKAMTSAILLQLEAAGKLSINDSLGKFLPQYPAWKNVTIKRLLEMTSGIPSYDNTDGWMTQMVAHPDYRFSLAKLVSYVYPATPGAPRPTHGWSYSNTNFILGEMIIEKVAGDSYQREVQKRITSGVPVSDMYYSPDRYPADVSARMVSGYFFNHTAENKLLAPLLEKDVKVMTASWAQGAGGAVGSPQAMTVWVRALYQSTAFLPAAQREELEQLVSMQTGEPVKSTSLDDPRAFGLGVAQLTTKATGTIWFYEGETLGYRMVHAYFPKQNVVLAVGLNSQPDPEQDKVGALVTTIYETLHKYGKM